MVRQGREEVGRRRKHCAANKMGEAKVCLYFSCVCVCVGIVTVFIVQWCFLLTGLAQTLPNHPSPLPGFINFSIKKGSKFKTFAV